MLIRWFSLSSGQQKLMSFALCAAMTALSVPTLALAVEPTLDRIVNSGKIRIGYGQTPPFSYTGPDGDVVGYSIDICKRLVTHLQIRLELPKIDIEYVARTPSNRIQLLNDGSMDIECNSSTNTPERQKSVAFAYSHFYVATRYVALASQKLNTLDDLKGRSVSVALGTVNVGQINAINRQHRLNLSVVPVDSLQSAFDMVADAKVSAFAMDEILLRTMIAQSGNPIDYTLSTDIVAELLPYGFMMRLDDTAFEAAVNAALLEIYSSPEMASIYQRWFERPIPGSGINLALPMSDRLKHSFDHPDQE